MSDTPIQGNFLPSLNRQTVRCLTHCRSQTKKTCNKKFNCKKKEALMTTKGFEPLQEIPMRRLTDFYQKDTKSYLESDINVSKIVSCFGAGSKTYHTP
jgi:hypothetical protein